MLSTESHSCLKVCLRVITVAWDSGHATSVVKQLRQGQACMSTVIKNIEMLSENIPRSKECSLQSGFAIFVEKRLGIMEV